MSKFLRKYRAWLCNYLGRMSHKTVANLSEVHPWKWYTLWVYRAIRYSLKIFTLCKSNKWLTLNGTIVNIIGLSPRCEHNSIKFSNEFISIQCAIPFSKSVRPILIITRLPISIGDSSIICMTSSIVCLLLHILQFSRPSKRHIKSK